jgi:hypothetical protein
VLKTGKGFNRCSDCDIELVSSLPESGKEDEEENKLMKDRNNNEDITFAPLLSTFNLGDIALLKSILDNQGIEYFIKGENIAYIRGYMDPAILMVREDQIKTVKELLKDFDLKFTMLSAKQ